MNTGQSLAQNDNLPPTDASRYQFRNNGHGSNGYIGHHPEMSGLQNTRLSEGALAGTAIRAYEKDPKRTVEEVADGSVGGRIIKFPGNLAKEMGGEEVGVARPKGESYMGGHSEIIDQSPSRLQEQKSDERTLEPHEPETSRDGATTDHAEGNTPSETVRKVSDEFEEDPFTAYKLAREAAKKEYDKLSNDQKVAA